MRDSIMLYRYPGSHEIHGDLFDYIIVPENDAMRYIVNGWHLTTDEAKAAAGKPVETPKDNPGERLTYEDFSDFEKESIRRDERPMMTLAKVHNTTYHTIRKIKGRT